ncbi:MULTISPECIES: Flp pilus assembly protein CpaB [unclassified Rhizobium]|uniref:Flp pilus assembly protein CpaB n=1 Tax=unclassified Rhizobium TaxID=2613769 RepID=UPI001AD969EA|nr:MULTISPECIES: Flp pilus assembly protein CpaB [unclassified Rhizobium]MBO9096706.1 Flp pilus assembly protein CpaB [Rhizobium sp. L58/93]MBO9134421.1 Flp pilus assembly protein CpaB [Rhizobium sp. B209b/85]MBO9166961.1 Flp pilus assembly protein CpaB [Rhizobium sp. L245/93]MBO9182933.1 Flp pilus assembly protein CpaB [Rhizobium sp. E27B/91]QXZ83303.1 Flp pilus assembly protein CpaB [Rhizobium sp. K1/93]
MKPARLIILVVAVGAAGLAGILAMRLAGGRNVVPEVATVMQREPSVKVLVAAANLPIGSRLNDSSIRWMDWPEAGVVKGVITETDRPDALKDMLGAVVRLPIFEGEPIREEKVADSNSRILSSLLPAGKRAVATEISVATGAGGFILPNDRVDILMVRKGDSAKFQTETILSNVRVLAIDQQIEQKPDGSKSAVGATATLELTPDQAKVLATAQQMADKLSMALRSVADAQEPDTGAADYLLSGDSGASVVQVIKSGAIVPSGAAIKVQ